MMVAGPSGALGTDVTSRAVPARASTSARAPTLHRIMGYLALGVIARQACVHCRLVRVKEHVIYFNRMTVNGVWSAWGLWESCSVTCDGGMQMRMRSCTSPDAGNHCPGKPSEHRVCSLQACQDGAWSSWERWNVCSITCGGGIKRRQRHCNNPPPSPSGRYCDGSSEQTLICNNNPCPVK
ncbi:HMCN1-like protein, partial [Mya arenaria]